MTSSSDMDAKLTQPGPTAGQGLHAEDVEELLRSVREDLLVLLGPFEVDEAEAGERVREALLALAGEPGGGDLRARFLETVGRAVHTRWAERDPLEEDDAVH